MSFLLSNFYLFSGSIAWLGLCASIKREVVLSCHAILPDKYRKGDEEKGHKQQADPDGIAQRRFAAPPLNSGPKDDDGSEGKKDSEQPTKELAVLNPTCCLSNHHRPNDPSLATAAESARGRD